jgi:hypothetical protein
VVAGTIPTLIRANTSSGSQPDYSSIVSHLLDDGNRLGHYVIMGSRDDDELLGELEYFARYREEFMNTLDLGWLGKAVLTWAEVWAPLIVPEMILNVRQAWVHPPQSFILAWRMVAIL